MLKFLGPTQNKSQLSKLKKVWDTAKREKGLTQTKAAKALGIRQATFSQYLNGRIPLNTNFVFNLAELIGVQPGEISKELGRYRSLSASSMREVRVLFSVSGSLKGVKAMVPTALQYKKTSQRKADEDLDLFAVYIDEELQSPLIRIGSYLIVSAGAKVQPSELCWVLCAKSGRGFIMQLKNSDKDSVTLVDLRTGETNAKLFDEIHSMAKVVSIQV